MLASLVKRYSAGNVAAVGAGAAAAVSAPIAACAAKEEKDKDGKMAVPSFDPEALERGAKALREINASPYAKKVRPGLRHMGSMGATWKEEFPKPTHTIATSRRKITRQHHPTPHPQPIRSDPIRSEE